MSLSNNQGNQDVQQKKMCVHFSSIYAHNEYSRQSVTHDARVERLMRLLCDASSGVRADRVVIFFNS